MSETLRIVEMAVDAEAGIWRRTNAPHESVHQIVNLTPGLVRWMLWRGRMAEASLNPVAGDAGRRIVAVYQAEAQRRGLTEFASRYNELLKGGGGVCDAVGCERRAHYVIGNLGYCRVHQKIAELRRKRAVREHLMTADVEFNAEVKESRKRKASLGTRLNKWQRCVRAEKRRQSIAGHRE